jgi:hypothetical protein
MYADLQNAETIVKHKQEDGGLVWTVPQSLPEVEAEAAEASKPTRVLTVVLSCHKNKHLWKSIIDKGIEDLVIIVGHEGMHHVNPSSLSHTRLSEHTEMRLEGHMLYLGCNDCYEGLPVKIVKMIDYVLNSDRFKHITHVIKIDDHDNVFEKSTIERIQTLDELRVHDFIGQKLNSGSGMRNYHIPYVSANSHWRRKLYDGEITPWLHGGSSYVVSRKALRIINAEYNVSNICQVYWNEIFEDVMVAKILRKNNIFPLEMNYGVIGDRP